MREHGIGQINGVDTGLTIENLTKINVDPPLWFVDINSVRVELSTDHLYAQHLFAKLCIDKVNKLPKRLRNPAWEKFIAKLLADVRVVDAPSDASPLGQFEIHLENFCIGRAQARTKEEMLLGKVWVEDERMFFRSQDLILYLQQQKFKDFTQQKIWSVLESMGGSKKQFNVHGRCLRAWSIPAIPFVQTEGLSPPRMTTDF